MSRLREKLALDTDYLTRPIDIQLDIILIPYIERVGKIIAEEIGFPFSGAVTDEIYKIVMESNTLTEASTLLDIQNAVNTAAVQWQQSISNQSVASRRD